jgi:hypothetical protein
MISAREDEAILLDMNDNNKLWKVTKNPII